jgi:hypothetical protein
MEREEYYNRPRGCEHRIIIFVLILILLASCAVHREQKQAHKYWYYQQIDKEKNHE